MLSLWLDPLTLPQVNSVYSWLEDKTSYIFTSDIFMGNSGRVVGKLVPLGLCAGCMELPAYCGQ